MVSKVWRYGYVINGQNERIRRRKSTPQRMYAEERLKSEIIQEAMAKEMALAVVLNKAVSIR